MTRKMFNGLLVQLAISLGFEVDDLTCGVYWKRMEGVSPDVLVEALGKAADQPWRRFPQPAELKALCAGVASSKRQAAAKYHLTDCAHDGHWIDTGHRVERCPCWMRAMAAMDAAGQPIVLPERTDSEDEGC